MMVHLTFFDIALIGIGAIFLGWQSVNLLELLAEVLYLGIRVKWMGAGWKSKFLDHPKEKS